MTVRDGQGRVVIQRPVPFLPTGQPNYKSAGVVKVPYAKPRQIGLPGLFLPTYAIDPAEGPVSLFPDLVEPRLALTAFVSKPGDDAMTTGAASSVYVLDTSRLEQLKAADGQPLRLLLAPGATATLPGGAGTVSFDGVRRYAAFDVRYDPTKPWVLRRRGPRAGRSERLPVRPPPAGLVQREHRRRRPYRGRGRGAVPRGRPAAGRRGAVAARGGRAAGGDTAKGTTDGTTKGTTDGTTRGTMQGSAAPGITVPGATVQGIEQGEE